MSNIHRLFVIFVVKQIYKKNTSMKKINLTIGLFAFWMVAFTGHLKTQTHKVKISTEYGDMIVVLYDETPKHRDNFLKLAKEGFYNGTIFHRVIKNFMVQGGDPQSKTAAPTTPLGGGGPGYTLPAEINPKYCHKKGALAAARMGDNVNPKKESSGSQFYIVHGNTCTPEMMKQMEERKAYSFKSKITRDFLNDPKNTAYMERFKKLQEEKNQEAIQAFFKEIEPLVQKMMESSQQPKYSPEQIKAYTEQGGTPHLDMEYTVFGELVEGFDVLDKIAAAEIGNMDRPAKDIKMTVTVIK
jgi:cyclophilin family peptidyl-prolyl cis-trans isomerase